MMTAQIVDDLRKPEGQWWSEIGSERKLMPDRNCGREISGWRPVEQCRHQSPQERLHEHGQPDCQRRTRAQQLNQNGDVKHQPRALSGYARPRWASARAF